MTTSFVAESEAETLGSLDAGVTSLLRSMQSSSVVVPLVPGAGALAFKPLLSRPLPVACFDLAAITRPEPDALALSRLLACCSC